MEVYIIDVTGIEVVSADMSSTSVKGKNDVPCLHAIHISDDAYVTS